MDCNVVYESDYIVRIEYNNVTFTIQKRTNILSELSNSGPSTNIVIPRILPSGHRIQYLLSDMSNEVVVAGAMVKGDFEEIAISDGIFVGCSAFNHASVKKVIWNDCLRIPANCFYHSCVEEVANINSVKEVMEYAFSKCTIKEMVWPECCDTIPDGCFMNCSQLDKLIAPYVRRIGTCAFSFSSIPVFDWPAACTEIPKCCFTGSKLTKLTI